ncbi:MAG TPA: sugar ABC transporter substrate-binding protein [Rubrobacter sp.]
MNQLTRRQFLAAAGGTGAALWLGACGGGSSGSSDPMKGTLEFVTWGGPAEIKAFEAIISDFEDQNPGARIRLQETPFNEVRQTVDSSLEAEQGPDLFRVTYTDFGFYAASNVLIDLSEYLPSDFSNVFTEGLRAAVEFEGAPYGVPHHTDVSAIVYNKDLFQAAGIGALPDRLEDAWSWDEFLDVSRRLRDAQTGNRTAFGMNWQLAGAFRWLNWLYAAGGSLYNSDATRTTVDSPEARKTLDMFKTWFEEDLCPDNTSLKGSYVDLIFPAQTIAMISAGSFLVPTLEADITRFEYGTTYLPQDVGMSTDLGGNAVVATQQTEKPELAAKFLEFLVNQKNMKRFCEATNLLPTRNDLVEQKLDYEIRPDIMPVFVDQSTTITPAYTRAVTVPDFTQVNNAFVDQLESFIVGDQSPEATLGNIAQEATDVVRD